MLRRCSRCQRQLDPTEFGKWSRGPGGLKTWCRTCVKTDSRRRRLAENPNAAVHRRHSDIVSADGLTKQCGDCRNWKSVDEYTRYAQSPDGLSRRCRACSAAYQAALARSRGVPVKRRRDPSHIAAGLKECFHCDELLPLSLFRSNARGYAGVVAYCKPCAQERDKSRENYRARTAKRTRDWRRNNETWKTWHARYMTKRRLLILAQSTGRVTSAVVAAIYNTETCYYCGNYTDEKRRTMEHKMPLSRGGLHDPDNLAMACLSCNCSKQDKTEEEYRGVSSSRRKRQR